MPSIYDCFEQEDIKSIAKIPWFSRTEVHVGEQDDFVQLDLYDWDGLFYWNIQSDGLSSLTWRDVIDVDDVHLRYYETAQAKLSCHVPDVAKCMNALDGGTFVEPDCVNVDIWVQRFRSERDYVVNVERLPEYTLDVWHRKYIIQEDDLCSNMEIVATGLC